MRTKALKVQKEQIKSSTETHRDILNVFFIDLYKLLKIVIKDIIKRVRKKP